MNQQHTNYGCLPAKFDARDYTICSANANVEYPSEFKLENLPRVKNQGMVNSCCAHATSSILEYHAQNKYKLSTNFIYGIQKKLFNQCQMGMYLAQACQIAREYGDMTEVDCYGNDEIPFCYKKAERALDVNSCRESAYRFRINSYYSCKTDKDIKFALMKFGPVLGAVNWKESFTIDKNGVVYFSKSAQGGGHAIMIVGWNSTGWIIQNSWGTSFGNQGIFVLPYEYGFLEARAIVDEENDEELFVTGILKKPVNNKFLNFFYKIYNMFVNVLFH